MYRVHKVRKGYLRSVTLAVFMIGNAQADNLNEFLETPVQEDYIAQYPLDFNFTKEKEQIDFGFNSEHSTNEIDKISMAHVYTEINLSEHFNVKFGMVPVFVGRSIGLSVAQDADIYTASLVLKF